MSSMPVIPSPWLRLASTDIDKRPIHFVTVPTIAAAMDLPLPSGVFFKLFIASEIPQQVGDASYEVAKHFAFAGCCYMCAWGASCSEWDDNFDYAVIIPRVDESHDFGYPDDENHHQMTAWFPRESLNEARWFFCSCAHPTEGFRPNSPICLAIAIGGAAFGATVSQSLLKGTETPAESGRQFDRSNAEP